MEDNDMMDTSGDNEVHSVKKHPLERPTEGKSKGECLLATGMYGPRGERVKHVAYPTALYLPPEALQRLPTDKPTKEIVLPSQGTVIRPSVDPSRSSMKITELTGRYVPSMDPSQPMVYRSIATNKVIALNHNLERIRGGGEADEGKEEASQKPAPASSAPPASADPTPSAPPAAAAPVSSAAPAAPEATTPSSSVPVTNPGAPAPDAAKKEETTAGSDAATAVPSEAKSNPPEPKIEPKVEPKVVPLDKKPAAQWEQHSLANAPPANPPIPERKLTLPEWYKSGAVHLTEEIALPEWFNESASHRTPDSYQQARDKLFEMSRSLQNRHITATMVRRTIPGDAGSLVRMYQFWKPHILTSVNDSTPTCAILRGVSSATSKKRSKDQELVSAVIKESRKRPKRMDWEAVAKQLGITAVECQRRFLSVESMEELDVSSNDAAPLVTSPLDDAVVSKVLETAVECTDTIQQAHAAAVSTLPMVQAHQQARTEETGMAVLLDQILDLRMKRMEERFRALDEVEGLLEADRVALELERRDLYTARCRHWFGGP